MTTITTGSTSRAKKVVLIIRREPQLDDEKSAPFSPAKQTTLYATFNHKATTADQQNGAAGHCFGQR